MEHEALTVLELISLKKEQRRREKRKLLIWNQDRNMSDWAVSCNIPTPIPSPTHIHMTNICTKMLFLAVKAVRQEDGFSWRWTLPRSSKNKITNQNNNNFKGFWRVSLGWTDCAGLDRGVIRPMSSSERLPELRSKPRLKGANSPASHR